MFRISALMISGLAAWTGLSGCLPGVDGNGPSRVGTGESTSIRLQLRPTSLMRTAAAGGTSGGESAIGGPAPDSVSLSIMADDMEAIAMGFSGDSLSITLDELPPGKNRLVSAELFGHGRRLYAGSITCDFRKESRLDLTIPCRPLFASVSASFHLPLGLGRPVIGGRLALSGRSGLFSQALVLRDEFASATVEEVPGGDTYDVSMVLQDSAGKTLYESIRTGVVFPQGQAIRLDLSLLPAAASAAMNLTLEAAPGDRVEAAFPSRRRAPAGFGEMVVTGFYPAPAAKDSASEGEWFTLYNRTADTLNLSGCRIGRDRSLGVTHALPFDSEQYLAPGRPLLFGRAAVNADVHYGDFQMTNSGGSLILICGDGSLIDSLRYSTASTDSLTALPSKEGWVTGLDRFGLSRRAEPSSWCLSHAFPTRFNAMKSDGISPEPAQDNATLTGLQACFE